MSWWKNITRKRAQRIALPAPPAHADFMVHIPGADDALLGYVWRCGEQPFLVYDFDALVAVLVKDGMSEEDAYEWISVNVEGAHVGKGTPGVLNRI